MRPSRSNPLNLYASHSRPILPLALLITGLSTVFIFVSNRGLFYRNTWNLNDRFHDFQWISSHHLAIATNFSISHHFLGFEGQSLDAEGNMTYLNAYNRFPPVGYVLIKLVTLLAGDDLSNRIYAAQMLILVFFVGSAVLIYYSLCRLGLNRWVASTAILMVFSSTPFLSYNDMILTELWPDLFGVVLAFHGMIVFVQEGRFRQLVLKACIAVLLGWHVLALLVTFLLLCLVKKMIQVRHTKTIRPSLALIAGSRYCILGVVTLALGALIFAYNIGNEYYALNIREMRHLDIADLPSLRSILYRTGLSQEVASGKSLDLSFFEGQFARIGLMSVPFIWSGFLLGYSAENWALIETQNFYLGILVVGVCVIGVFKMRQRLLSMTALVFGFCWAIPMYRNTLQHEYDSIFYIGIPLVFYTLLLLFLKECLGEGFVPLISVVSLLIFLLSSYRMGNTDRNERAVEFHKSMVEDFNAIRDFTKGKNVWLPIRNNAEEIIEFIGARYGFHYYLSESNIIFTRSSCDRRLDKVDYMIRTGRDDVPGLLTPNNRMAFLYDNDILEQYVDKIVEGETPIIRSDFDVYLTDDRKLVYTRGSCDEDSFGSAMLNAPISLTIYSGNAGGSTDSSIDELSDPNFVEEFVIDTEQPVIIFDLPDYAITSITTGQYTDQDQIWGGRFFGPEHVADYRLLQRVDQAIASGSPIIRAQFDVYLADDNLVYIRKPCDTSDINDDFFVHIIPVDIENLPEDRRPYGFENLDFALFDRGFRDGQRCAAVIELPDYDISRIRTGQFTDQGETWRSEFYVEG